MKLLSIEKCATFINVSSSSTTVITTEADLQEIGADGVDQVFARQFAEHRKMARLNQLRELLPEELDSLSLDPDAAMRLRTPVQN